MNPLLAFQEAGDMKQMVMTLRRLIRSDDGQDLLEYALLVALIAVVAAGSVAAVGNTLFSVFWQSIGQAV